MRKYKNITKMFFVALLIPVLSGTALAAENNTPNWEREYDYPESVLVWSYDTASENSTDVWNENSDLTTSDRPVRPRGEVKKGDIVTYGTYPQTAGGRDNSDIEWIVLNINESENKVLLISRYVLRFMKYVSSPCDVTWKTSGVRKWLNGSFYDNAFSSTEKRYIKLTDLSNDNKTQGLKKGAYGNTTGGPRTDDYLFLMSYKDVNKYFDAVHYSVDPEKKKKPRVAATDYAWANTSLSEDEYYTTNGNRSCRWWLRTPGRALDNVMMVYANGQVTGVDLYGEAGVRPMMWVDPKAFN